MTDDRSAQRLSKEWFALLLLGVGIAFRLFVIPDARFTGDESYFWSIARNIARFKTAPVFGPPLTGSAAAHPGPIFYYLMAVPQLLGASPFLGSIFVTLLHGVAGGLLYAVTKEAIGLRGGLIALALWLFAPWDVLYGDRIWLSCVAPVWGMFTIHAAVKARDSSRWLGALVVFVLVCPQLHMSAPVVWGAVAVILFIRRPRVAWRRPLAIGLAVSVICYAPAIYHELTHAFQNTIAILTKGTGGTSWGEATKSPLLVAWYAVLFGSSEIGYHFARGYWIPFRDAAFYLTLPGLGRWVASHGPIAAGLTGISVTTSLIAWGWTVGRIYRSVRSRFWKHREDVPLTDTLILALWAGFLAASLLLFASRKPFYPHYANLLMPFSIFVVAAFLDRCASWRRARFVTAGVVVLSAISMVINTTRYYREIDALNGLSVTLDLAARAVDEPQPIQVRFAGFNNGFAWRMLAGTLHEKPLTFKNGSRVRYRVENGRRLDERAGGERVGAVWLVRSGPRQQ